MIVTRVETAFYVDCMSAMMIQPLSLRLLVHLQVIGNFGKRYYIHGQLGCVCIYGCC